jgi:hypothetical protein
MYKQLRRIALVFLFMSFLLMCFAPFFDRVERRDMILWTYYPSMVFCAVLAILSIAYREPVKKVNDDK